MGNHFRVAGALARRLEELGLSADAVLRRAGLPVGLFNQERVLVTTEEFFALYRGIMESSEDPAIGLKLGTESRVERYDPIGIAALSARSFRDALERLARYKQLTCPEKIRLAERGEEYTVQFDWLLAERQEPAMLVDVCFAWVVEIGRRGTDSALNPKRVELEREPAHRELYEAHFGCPVRFKAGRNVLVFHTTDTRRPFLTHNPDLLAMVAPQLEVELTQQLASKTTGEQVKTLLKRMLAGQRPEMAAIAKELRMSSRTLQRRLTQEGSNFQTLVQEARRDLARHYLLHSSLELNETAYLLGYEDANSFFRAFHNWEGTSPGEWRAAHRA